MNIYIVDASVAAKWFIEEDYRGAALSVLGENNRLHAPDFLLLEMDSIILKWIRRGIVTTAEGSDLRDAFSQYPIQRHPLVSLLDSAYAIAIQTQQSIYDCLYVALAALLDGKMVTADRRLYDGLADGPFAKHAVWVEDIG